MYNFLKNLTLVDTGRQRMPKETNPKGLTIRIYHTGQVYPSVELVEKFDLEYKPIDPADRDNSPILGNGLDIVDSHEWEPMKEHPRMILMCVTPRKEPKVDLFARCLHNPNDGKPKASVLTQGTVNAELLNLCRSMGYMTESQKYVDLEVVIDHPITPQEGIAFLPKKIEKGARKGEDSYERRENVVLYPMNTPENLKELAEEIKKLENVNVSTTTVTASSTASNTVDSQEEIPF